ncbi:MAG: hypothetical protein IPI85_17255 [Dehalococcoidia bacterium]|nr:hypothetical protein [Dehalococcoidia bacterium]
MEKIRGRNAAVQCRVVQRLEVEQAVGGLLAREFGERLDLPQCPTPAGPS